MTKSNVSPATEIVVSLVSQYADVQGSEQLQNDPRTYIYKTTHINIPEQVDIAVVQNTGGTVNLILPYYNGIERELPEALDEDAIGEVSGGYVNFYQFNNVRANRSRDNSGDMMFLGHDIMSSSSGSNPIRISEHMPL